MGQNSATIRDKGTEVPSLSRDKGTAGQAQSSCHGMVQARTVCQNPGYDAGRDNHCFIIQFPVLERPCPFPVLERPCPFWFLLGK